MATDGSGATADMVWGTCTIANGMKFASFRR
jgi:hypothetical protein